ncbi:kelch repeat and BTB domain-containing protein 8-like isoform X2 [Branchiostoma floridae x Branchiostoma japonicum]
MFTSGYAEAKQERISIQDVSGVAMATILDYAYTGCLQTEPDQVQPVMSAARLLQVDFIGYEAAEYMRDHLDVSNCVDVLMYADVLTNSDLVEASKKYMASRFDQVALQPSFVQLPLNHLQPLLDRDDLLTNSEDNVVQAALKWVDFNQEERLQHLSTLSKSVRRSLISTKLCVEIERKCRSTDSKLVYSDSTAQRLGHVRTELQIFVRAGFSSEDYALASPCYDPSTGRLYTIDMPEDLDSCSRSVTVTPDDELYMAGDIVTSREFGIKDRQKKFYQYNHLLDTWESRCGMIESRYRCGMVYLKGYIYAIGGDDTKGTAERYDPSCDEWTSIPPMPHPMSSKLCAVTLDDNIYVISNKGCYSFSTTKNKWKKRADMIIKPLRPQAVTYQGCIYCMDTYRASRVEMYNPTTREWKQSWNGSYGCSTAILMKYGETLYLLTVQYGMGANSNTTFIYMYQPETDSWLEIKDRGSLVAPLAEWLGDGSSTDCLTARMVPKCLGDPDLYEDDHDGGEDDYLSSSESPRSDRDSDDLSDQEDDY